MANIHAVRDWTVGYLIREDVDVHQALTPPPHAYLSVLATTVAVALPLPALVRAASINFRPKAFCDWFHTHGVAHDRNDCQL